MKFLFFPILLCLLFCCSPDATAATMPTTDENIHIKADRMTQNAADGIYSADGNVVVLWQGATLTASQVSYKAATRMLHASGGVVLAKETSLLKGESLILDMNSGHAEIVATQLTIPDSNMTIVAEKITRTTETEFTASATELTTCDTPDPSWKFGADKLNVNLLGYATGRNVIFYVKDIPVLYLPWIAFPVVLEKRSGLLFPRVGTSTSRGAQLDIPVYWVISPSQDLQFDLDIMSRRGVGTGIDYRYIRTRGSEGRTSVYQVYDQVENRWRWQLGQEHKEIFSPDANLRVSSTTSSDRIFLADFGEKSGDYNRQSSETILNTLNTWQNYAITSYLRYTEDLYAATNRSTLQTLPSLGMAGVRHQIFSMPLYFDLDSSAANLYREEAPSGQRLYLFPRITLLPFKNSYLQASFFAGAHIRGYNTDRRDNNSGVQAHSGDILPEAGARFSTSLTRSYEIDSPVLKKIRHEIIPELRYSYAPERDQRQLPLYDYTDTMIYRNMVALSATSLLNGTFVSGDTTEYRELSRLKIEARYSFAGEQRDLLTLVERHNPWSDLIIDSETWLTQQLKLIFDTRYSLYGDHASTVVAGFEFDDRKGNAARAGYQMARSEVEYFEGRIATTVIKPLNLSYLARYSFDRSDFLESVYAAEYRHKCWSVNMAVHQRPGNQSYSINLTLAGLGDT